MIVSTQTKHNPMMLLLYTLATVVVLLCILLFWIRNPVFFTKTDITVASSRDRLYRDVKFMTEINPPRNYANTPSLNQVADYIRKEFDKLGEQVELQKYQVGDIEYKNIICSFGTQHEQRIIVAAHYDVCDDQPGADDNASGVAGVLEVARLIHELKPKLKYRIDLVAYSLEEPPHFRTQYMGSYVHAKSLADAKANIKAMICLEMIGYYSDKPNSQQFPVEALKNLYPSTGNFIAVVGNMTEVGLVRNVKTSMQKASAVPVYSINAPDNIPGIDFSDHQNFWKFGFPAVMITDTAFFRNPNYHKRTDTIDTLDFGKMSEVVKCIYNAVINL